MDSELFLVREKPEIMEADVAERSPCGRYGRYKKILGRGAFKDVYKGFDQVDRREIAWNQISVDDDKSLENQGTLLCSEAVRLKSLDHRSIMKCYSYWVDYNRRTVNMITEFFGSGSLRQYVKKLGGVDVQTIKDWGRQILQGLEYLHTRKPCIVHRDVKCDNIFLDGSNGAVKIGDFGLATVMEQSPLRALAGTPEFMAPEYYDEEYNELVDVYAFGMCLMELATLEHPYAECTNPAQIFKKVSSGIRPAALGKVKDAEVKEVIEKCLLPASLRPSAVELLKDQFFSSQLSSKISCRSSSMDDSATSSSVGFGADEVKSQYMHDSILSEISALYNSISMSDINNGRLPSSCYHSSVGDVSMISKITFASSSGAVSKDIVLFHI